MDHVPERNGMFPARVEFTGHETILAHFELVNGLFQADSTPPKDRSMLLFQVAID